MDDERSALSWIFIIAAGVFLAQIAMFIIGLFFWYIIFSSVGNEIDRQNVQLQNQLKNIQQNMNQNIKNQFSTFVVPKRIKPATRNEMISNIQRNQKIRKNRKSCSFWSEQVIKEVSNFNLKKQQEFCSKSQR